MSDNIPIEILVEFMKRLPVKSVVQLRSVSKSWRSLIDSSEFIAGYRVRQIHPQLLLVFNKDPVDTKERYISFVDDESLAQQELAMADPVLFKSLYGLKLVGSSQGLLCLCGYLRGHPLHIPAIKMAVLWNPSIRKTVGIAVPTESSVEIVLGFGVCPITNDPTVVKIANDRASKVSSRRVEVFTLSKGSWRIVCCNQVKKSIKFQWSQAVIGSVIYWLAADMDDMHKVMIISFDMTTEKFREIDLPAHHKFLDVLTVSKVGESLAVLEYKPCTTFRPLKERCICAVWVMDHTVPNSFTKLFTVDAPYGFIYVLGFTNDGRPIMETREWDLKGKSALAVYEPRSEHVNDIGIYAKSGKHGSYIVSPYMETLLLVDQSDCKMWD